ncbi:MAG: SGNH/GDSL hydrolase family protein [Vicinamibacterales bacterium]
MRISLIIGVLLFAGAACSSKSDTPTAPTPSEGQATSYTAIGASDGIGFGGSAPCVPLALECANGTGYVQILNRRLKDGGRTVSHLNLSLPGAVLSRAIEDLATSIGRRIDTGNFIERQAPFVPLSTTQVTIFAGGNDANTIAQAARAGRGGSDVNGYVDAQVRQWGTDYEDLIRRIRDRSANTRIVALNLPNLAAAPYVASNPIDQKRLLQRIAVGLTDRVNALRSLNVIVVDLMCDARLLQGSHFAADGFHPNDAGYAIIAELTYPALANGSAPAPSATCLQRTIF